MLHAISFECFIFLLAATTFSDISIITAWVTVHEKIDLIGHFLNGTIKWANSEQHCIQTPFLFFRSYDGCE
jgi:hypothetical protein